MPLKDLNEILTDNSGVIAANVQTCQAKKQNSRSQVDSSTIHNGLSSHRPNQSRARRDSGASSKESFNSSLPSDEQRAKAIEMKMKPPAALNVNAIKHLQATHPQPVSAHIKSTSDSSERSVQGQKHHISAFDDTASFELDESTTDDSENVTRVFRGPLGLLKQSDGLNMRQNSSASRPHTGRAPEPKSTKFELARSQSMPVRETDSAQHGSRHQFMFVASRTHVRDQEPQTATKDKTLKHIDLDVMQAAVDTPSRIRSVPQQYYRPQSIPKTVKFIEQSPMSNPYAPVSQERERSHSPELTMPQNIPIQRRSMSQSMDTRQTMRPVKSPQNTRDASPEQSEILHTRNDPDPPSMQHTGKPFLDLGFLDSSEGQSAAVSGPRSIEAISEPEQSSHKRPREDDLDYDADTLIKKTFDDLRHEAFTYDPRDPPQKTSFDPSGHVVDLAQRLENLGQMREGEQKKLFRNQNDDEWAETGAWFVAKFQKDLQRLMEARLNRRKVSMLYEHEVRKRHKDVEWCSTGVAEELNDLKSKGTDLIKMRPGSRTGTPMKERA